jgi:hypothetical protein
MDADARAMDPRRRHRDAVSTLRSTAPRLPAAERRRRRRYPNMRPLQSDGARLARVVDIARDLPRWAPQRRVPVTAAIHSASDRAPFPDHEFNSG